MSTKSQDDFNKLVLKALETMSVTRGMPKDIVQLTIQGIKESKKGYDFSIMMFPAVKKNKSIIRAFVTSEHTKEQLEGCAEALIDAAKEYEFAL